jgi:hypothetical protein
MKTKLLGIDQILIEKEMYPRMFVDWVTTSRYYNAMKSGDKDKFPLIKVAELDGKYFLIDGAHRLKALKDLKETHILAEVVNGLDKKQIYLEAIKANISHGRQFSTQEVTKICITLKDWDMNDEQIQEIVRIPSDGIKRFVAKRMTRVIGTSEEIALKRPLQNLSFSDVEEEPNQKNVGGRSQEALLDSVIALLRNGWMEVDNEIISKKLIRVYKLIGKLGLSEPPIVEISAE